jgi:hypothetical protein
MTVGQLIDRFLVANLEEHADQLERRGPGNPKGVPR